MNDREISKLSILKLTSTNEPQKQKAKFLRKNHAHLFGCQLWWFCFLWTKSNRLQFKSFWVQFDLVAWQTILNVSHLSSKVDVFNMDSTSMVCFLSLISTPCFHDWVIASFPKNARERFLLQCRTAFEWDRVPRRTHFSFQKSACLQNLLSTLSSACGETRARLVRSMNVLRVFGARRSAELMTNLGHQRY